MFTTCTHYADEQPVGICAACLQDEIAKLEALIRAQHQLLNWYKAALPEAWKLEDFRALVQTYNAAIAPIEGIAGVI